MEQRYWACCIDQNTNTGPKPVDREKAWSGLGLSETDDTFFECQTWTPERQQAERIIGLVTPTTTVARILENEGNLKAETGAKDHEKEREP
ncbi:hypothetical protein Trydic_g5772 [Trypoxylus dichotomus]